MKKKWGKGDRELAKYDLILGLFIPFILGASCLIISTASQFHAKKDGVISEVAYNQVLDKRLVVEYPDFSKFESDLKINLRKKTPLKLIKI